MSTLAVARRCTAEQAAALEGRGVDLIVLETFTSLDELVAAAGAVRSVASLPLIVQVTVRRRRRDRRPASPPDVPAAAGRVRRRGGRRELQPGAADGAGRVRADAAPRRSLPLIAQANAGLPNVHDGRLVYPDAAPSTSASSRRMRCPGRGLIGGCCGTTPDHIAAIRRAVSEHRPPARAAARERGLPTAGPRPTRRDAARAQLAAGESVVSVELDPPKGAEPRAPDRAATESARLAASTCSTSTTTRWRGPG